MNSGSQSNSLIKVLVEIFGIKTKGRISIEKRKRQVVAVTLIGIVFGFLFALFNLATPNMALLGDVELIAVLILIPAALPGRRDDYVAFAENCVMLSAMLIVGALVAFGGIEGTGLFWVYVAPFLAFSLKGQRQGWLYSIALMLMMALYFVAARTFPHVFYQHSPVVVIQFTLSLGFYTLIAAAFNHLRSRFEEQLQNQVEIKTADSKKLLNQLTFLASHDRLTQLPNRVLLTELLHQEIAAIGNTNRLLIVCMLKLERTGQMSNILGSSGADLLILKIADYLERFVATNGVLAQPYRDEFVVAYQTTPADFNEQGLRRFIAERQISIEVNGYVVYCELTLGVAIFPDHAEEPQLLLNKAQQAVLQAQKNGQQWLIYDSKREKAFVRHHLLFGKLREALMQQHLQVHYQPQIDLNNGQTVGAEALMRWFDPLEGFISPLEFIPVSEESGLIRPLTTWLIGVCMRDCVKWRAQGFDLHISINLSAMNLLDPDLLDVLQAALNENNLSAFHITLEITESCFMTSPERAMEVIQRLHDLGFRLAIDDFGTGYSSLSYLKNLPIHELKIDQSFVRNLLQNKGDQAIVSSTIDLAHNFSLAVVAEGIEDAPTGQWLHARGCDIGQGYFFAKPMSSDAFSNFLEIQLKNRAVNLPTGPI